MRMASLILLVGLNLSLPVQAEAPALETEDHKVLYSLGLALSRNLQVMDFSADEVSVVLSGVSDGILGNEPRVDLATFGPKIDELLQTRAAAVAKRQEEAGAAFRAAAANEEGAVTTESGLIYLELAPGQGESPTVSDAVKVHYHGTLPDGTVFDSTRERGEPASFSLGGVIPCFGEALQRMKQGGKSKVTCAPDLAYGERGAPPTIGPGATLVFEVELLEIVRADPPPAPAEPALP